MPDETPTPRGDAPPPPSSHAPRPASMAQLGWILLAVAVLAVILFLALGPAWGRLFPDAR